MITIRGLAKSQGSRRVLVGIDAEVAEGAIVALVGASGSGKTSLLRCLNGLDPFDAGHVRIAGHDLEAGPARRLPARLRSDVGLVFQDYQLFPHLSVLDNVSLAPRVVGGQSRDAAESIARAWLERVGLAPRELARPSELSGGEKQRVALARALAQGARVLLLDEPTSALDSANRDEVRQLLLSSAREGLRRLTLLVVTHDRSFAEALADEVWSLEGGRLL
jgi:ABC-type polar amino acid transport system ATPase subunit